MAARPDGALLRALEGEETPIFMATLDAQGKPNCVPIISTMPYDDGTLIFGEFLMNKTKRNLLGNPKVGIAVLSAELEAWSLKGTFLGFETSGERLDAINQTPTFRYNAYTGARSAGSIRVEEISEGRRLTKAQVLSHFLWTAALARVLRPRRRESPCMPRQVEDKFGSMSAVRALAYREEDGFPRAFPVMACVAAGPNRLLMADPLSRPYASGMVEGTALAVAVITQEAIAYQVKGVYGGRRAGAGIIDLAECYSASPPLLGDRLDG